MTVHAKMFGIGLVAAMAIPSVAGAVVAPNLGRTYNNFTTAGSTGTFGNNGGIGNRNFRNVFTFVVSRAGDMSADISNSASRDNANSDIDFSAPVLTGGSLLAPVTFRKLIGEPVTLTELWELAAPIRIGAGTYTLTVGGRSYGATSTYSGNFNVAAVPEPATWAMMIGGFGMVGGAMRRRRTTQADVRVA